MDINCVTIQGRLGDDPELRTTGNGTNVCNCTVATGKPAKEKDKEKTEWHRVVCWGGLAQKIGTLKKGHCVLITGELQTRSWEKDGVKKYTTEIIANAVHPVTWEKKDKEAEPPKDDIPMEQLPF